MDYRGALTRLLGLVDFERISPGHQARYNLDRVNDFLKMLGSPHLGTPTVHITGTKGKGSTAAMCASVLRHQGHRVGLYTSPHLHSFCERIAVDGTPISREGFASLVDQLWPSLERFNVTRDDGPVTLFEMLTAMAFVHFRKVGTSWNVMEVGLGGRLDATNVVMPQVSVITSISLDHTAILGDTVELIAADKAGIIKPGIPVATAPQVPSVMEVIRTTCAQQNSRLVEVGRDVRYNTEQLAQQWPRVATPQGALVRGLRGEYHLQVPLLGDYQLENAATSVAAMEVLTQQGHHVSGEAVEQGIAAVRWPCRLEVLDHGDAGPLVVSDGAHNPYSAARLRDTLPRYFRYDKVVLVVGMSRDKNLQGMVEEFSQMKATVVVTRSRHPRAASPTVLAQAFQRHGIEAHETPGSAEALQAALQLAGPNDLVLATGSLFIAAEVRELVKGIAPELYPDLEVR